MKRQTLAVLASMAVTATAHGVMIFTVTNTSDHGTGSLRWAIEQANTTPGADMIDAAQKLSGTIALASPLPAITETVSIVCPLTIDGTNAGPTDGLVIAAESVYVEYLNVTHFNGDGIVISGDLATLEWVGTSGNRNGIRIAAWYSNIRGTAIVSNSASGVWITPKGSRNTIGRREDTCYFEGCGSPPPICYFTGCHDSPGPNEISGNGGAGVRMEGNENYITADWIGVTPQGNEFPNAGDGVVVSGAHNTVYYSTIANNGGHGVLFLSPARFENNLGACNAGGFVAGSLSQPPLLIYARVDARTTSVAGVFHGAPSTTNRIEIYSESSGCAVTATQPLGAVTVTTDSSGYASWTATFATSSVTRVAAMATRFYDEVSALSDAMPASVTGETRADLSVQTTAPPNTSAAGVIDLTTIVTNLGPASVDGFYLEIPRVTGADYLSATTTSGACYLGGLRDCYFGALGVGESVTLHEKVRVSATSGILRFAATAFHWLGSPLTDPNPSNNTAIVEVQVTPPRRHAAH